MSENENKVPKLRFPGFAGDWEERKLGELAKFSKGWGYSKSDLLEKGTPIVLYGRLYTKYQTVIDDVDTFVLEKKDSVYSTGNEVIVPASGETVKDIVRATAIRKAGILLGGDLNIIYPCKDIDTIFLALAISNGEQQKELCKKAQGKSVVHLHNADLESTIISFPNKVEQEKIVGLVSQVDELIAFHQRKLTHLEVKKNSLLQKMFPKEGEDFPELRFPGFTEAWKQRELGAMGETYSGLSGKTKEDFGHGEAAFITYMNVYRNSMADPNGTESIEIDSKQREVNYCDVLFTASSETPGEVGMSSVWLETMPNVYLNSFCFGYRPMIGFNPYYLGFMLRSAEVRKKFIFLAQGISRYNISKNKAMDILVPVPDIEEQKKVGIFLNSMEHLIALHQRKLEHMKELKKALLQSMFV